MPPRNNSLPRLRRSTASEPPEVMTWPKAMPVIIVALLFDLVRAFFDAFWFFGPALAALLCTTVVNNALGTTVSSILGVVVAGACTGVSASLGVATFGVTAAFGTLMAIAVGLFGWLVIGGWLMARNARIFKENILWFVASLAVSEAPIINFVPAMTLVLWRMHSHQIKQEKAAYAKWEKENAAVIRQQQNQQALRAAQLMQAPADELASADV